MGRVYGFVPSDWNKNVSPGRRGESGQIDLRGEKFSALIHGLEVCSKQNWLFVGHPEAGERSAVIYSLLGSCRRNGVNPFDYLEDLFSRLPSAKITQIRAFTCQRRGPAETTVLPVGDSWLFALRFFLRLGRVDFRPRWRAPDVQDAGVAHHTDAVSIR